MKIEVLGAGCKSCEKLYQSVLEAVASIEDRHGITVEKVNDINYFCKMGVFTTPGLVIDGAVLTSGKILSADQVKKQIEERLQG